MEFHGTQRLGGCCLLSRGIIREQARQRRISTVSMTHLPPGEGKSLWVSNNEFVTIKTTAKDTAGEFALVELVALPGAVGGRRGGGGVGGPPLSPPPPPPASDSGGLAEDRGTRAKVRSRVPAGS